METSSKFNPVGLYKDPASGQYIGAINEIQADAMVQQGWVLVEAVEGEENRSRQTKIEELASDENIERLKGAKRESKPEPEPVAADNSKGKK